MRRESQRSEKRRSRDFPLSVVVLMNVGAKIYERRGLLSAYETIQTILGFGMFTIALIALIVKLLKNDKKK